jgi:hypothetical protein
MEYMTSGLIVVMRGYDMTQVGQLLARADLASASTDPQLRRAAYQELQATRFRNRLRGYSRP